MSKSDDEIERMLRGDISKSQEEQELFHKIREYIRNNPGSSADDIAAATGIDTGVIFRFIREGKLFTK